MAIVKRLNLTIASNLEDVWLMGTTINKICSMTPLSDVDTYQLELCVVEACNNAIKHACDDQPGHKIEVAVQLHHNKILLDICDTGNPLEQAIIPSFEFDPEDIAALPEGGMGLFIIHEIMDKVTYKRIDNKNRLRLVKYFETKKKRSKKHSTIKNG